MKPIVPLREDEYDALATYNAERARGLVHTEVYAGTMAALQARYEGRYR